MIQAVAADFAATPEMEVVTTRDSRLAALHPAACRVTIVESESEEREAIRQLASSADWTLLIAPETGGALLERCLAAENAGGRILSPASPLIEIAANKQTTVDLLSRCGVPVPSGTLLTRRERELPRGFRFPLVVKPVDGCGSQRVRLIRRSSDLNSTHDSPTSDLHMEEYVPGLPASVVVLCGPAGHHALPACEQRLSDDGQFAYLGGRLPLKPQLDARAQRLALAAIAALPEPQGYVGVDLVLGEAVDGSGDRVIEINPRLTTSYVGLRAASHTNLAEAMLAVATGREPDLCFRGEQVEFTADGAITLGAP